MTPSQIQTNARALVARVHPSSHDAVVVAVESYGVRRLYPITAAADAIAALVGARTLDDRHLQTAIRLGIRAKVTTLDALTTAAASIDGAAAWWRDPAARAANRDQRAAYCEAVERGDTPPPPPPEEIRVIS